MGAPGRGVRYDSLVERGLSFCMPNKGPDFVSIFHGFTVHESEVHHRPLSSSTQFVDSFFHSESQSVWNFLYRTSSLS